MSHVIHETADDKVNILLAFFFGFFEKETGS